MKRWKKIALVLFCLLLLSQAPFAYRRFRLRRLSAAIAEVNAGRAPAPPGDPFDDYAGVFHVHSSLGGHSTGTLEEIVRAAEADRLAFVVMTEHPSALFKTSEATLSGTHEGVLFVPGSELAASDGGRLFAAPGVELPDAGLPLRGLVERAKGEGRLAVVGYPEQVRDLKPGGYDALEVYNLYTNAKRINYLLLFFDGLWSYFPYADLLFADFYERPGENLKRWDEINSAGRQRVFGNHVLVEKGEPLDSETLLSALRRGHSYFAFDLFGDPTGFRFTADDGADRRVMGDEISLPAAGAVRLSVRTPVRCRLLFFRDGQAVQEVKDTAEASLMVERAGVYRVEVYLDQLGSLLEGKPWII